MSNRASELKKDLREQLRQTVQKLPMAFREEASEKACGLLLNQAAWKNAKSILFYAPMSDEISTWSLVPQAVAAKKIVLFPRFNAKVGAYEVCIIEDTDADISPGKFGILEPCAWCVSFPLNRLDLTLVPGLGFDLTGGRLGRGRGFYDRLLAQVSGVRCGVAFDEQVVPLIPTEPHDIRLNCILTPTRWLSVAGARC